MDTFSDAQSITGHNHACSNTSRTKSVDLGVCVHMEINFDDSLLSNNLQEANEHKENTQTDCPNINLQPEEQNNNGELAEKEQYKNYFARSDPDLVIGSAGGLKDSTSAVIPKVANVKSVTSLSMLVNPPPLPPKRYQRSDQGSDFNEESKPMNSQMCQTSSLLCGIKGNNQCPDLTTGKIPDINNSCTFETVPKCSPKPPQKPPIKPPRLNKPKWAEKDDRKETEQSKHIDTVGDKGNKQEQDLSERKEKIEENHLDVGKPHQQILVIFTEKEKEGEDGQNRRKEDKDPSEELPTVDMKENSTLLHQAEKPDMAATNGRYIPTISTKLELLILAQPPPKPHRPCRPVPPIKPPHLSSAMLEEQRHSMKQEEERDESDEEGNDRENGGPRVPETTTVTMKEMSSQLGETVMKSIPKSSVNEEVDLPGGERQRFSLMPHCSNSPNPVTTPENQTLCHESLLPGTQHQSKEDGQFNSGPLSQKVPARVNFTGVASIMKTLRPTENNTDILMSGQVISKLASEHLQGTAIVRMKFDACQQEDTEGIGETLVDGELRQINQKPNAGRRVVKFAKKMFSKIKEGREEKRRLKVEEVEMDDSEVTQDGTWHWEEGGMKEEEERMDEDHMDQSAATESQIKRRHAIPESPFGSFRVCSPVQLVSELLSGKEWSPFLCTEQSSVPDSPPYQIQPEHTGQPSEDRQINANAELDPAPGVFEGSSVAPEEETAYEDIDLSHVNTDEQQEMNGGCCNATPQTLVESDANQMSLRTRDIYNTVELMQPVQPANTYDHYSDIKSQAVLDSSVQKYLIKLSKKRLHKRQRRGHDTLGQSSASSQVFTASIFYHVPAAGGQEEQQLSTHKSAGNSATSVAKTKAATKTKRKVEDTVFHFNNNYDN